MILESLLGGLFGGVLRLAPEILKWLDRKAERDHEFRLLDKELEFAKTKAEAELHSKTIDYQAKELDAVMAGLQDQTTQSALAGGFAAKVSALVRPTVTYMFILIYALTKLIAVTIGYQQAADWSVILSALWTIDDMAVLNMILSFWFVGRVYERQSKSP